MRLAVWKWGLELVEDVRASVAAGSNTARHVWRFRRSMWRHYGRPVYVRVDS